MLMENIPTRSLHLGGSPLPCLEFFQKCEGKHLKSLGAVFIFAKVLPLITPKRKKVFQKQQGVLEHSSVPVKKKK